MPVTFHPVKTTLLCIDFAIIYYPNTNTSRGTRLPVKKQAQVRALYQAGHSTRKIAAQLRRFRCAVSNYLKGPVEERKKKAMEESQRLEDLLCSLDKMFNAFDDSCRTRRLRPAK
ncbi:unnamed protein product [Heligmosomoides polygyrus]|uniref:HTH_Tnp_Tc3_1 domain-containing protein n=1 Tax=Heligmosomoides polygyrus TaxID=6339 RepID=A0A183FDR2_HELPZ|nr:unnamed protein product [Heligmosomoides polygyrus]